MDPHETAADAELRRQAVELLSQVVADLGPHGERREGQLAMCEAVADAITSQRHLIVTAGTGIGKSLAYLAPLVAAKRRAVIATATKSLQDQMVTKDLPQVARRAGITYAMLKGRSNYLCRKKLADLRAGEESEQPSLIEARSAAEADRIRAEIEKIRTWAEVTHDGDRAGLDFEPGASSWEAVSVTSQECPGAKVCPNGWECFAEQARAEAEEADLVVTNTYLYCLDALTDASVLPPHEVVVFDEAHMLEEIASNAAGASLTPNRFRTAARAVRAAVKRSESAADVADAAVTLREAMEPHADRLLDSTPAELTSAAALCRGRLDRANAELRAADTDDTDDTRRQIAQRALDGITGDLVRLTTPTDEDANWIETGRTSSWNSVPINVSTHLKEAVFGRRTAVLTSATIPTGLADTVGIDAADCDEIDAGSPFDYQSNALLYCAKDLPDPRTAGRDEAAHDQIKALVEAAGGRALVLFTSYAAMDKAAEALRQHSSHLQIHTQRDLPKAELVRRLAADDADTCVLATISLWQGIDVVGQALSLVVIDRLPFPRPDDPRIQARRRYWGAEGFARVVVPHAATLLAQGAGRLIRSAEDRGVVAVLDSRLAHARYRWDLLNTMPAFRRTGRLQDATDFLRSLR